MQIHQLKYILEVAKVGSMNKAAQQLFVSQPNLSSAIAMLEKELDITIFTRSNKGVEVTPEGKLALKYAKSIMAQVEQLNHLYHEDNKDKINFIDVTQSKGFYLTESITKCYQQFDYKLQFSLHTAYFSDVIKDVYNMKSEIGLIVVSEVQYNIFEKMLEHKKLEFIKLAKSEVCMVVSEHHLMSQEKEVTLENVSDATYLGYYDESAATARYYVDLDEMWWDFKGDAIKVNDLLTLRELLQSLDSYTFDLLINETYLKNQHLKCLKLKDKMEVNIGWIKRKSEELSLESAFFIDEVTNFYESVINKSYN